MIERPLPGTDIHLSVVGFGCWAIGGQYWGESVDDAVSVRAIHAALDVGINWFDTAPLYGEGHADEVLRDALSQTSKHAIIATKVGVRLGGEGEHASSDLTPDWIVDDTESSLARLGVECIDLLQVHWPCERDTPIDESLDMLERLREQGKIRFYGLCNYEADLVLQASSRPGMVSLQTPYSLLRREFEGSLLSAVSGAHPLGVLAYEPLCRGLLTGKFKQAPVFPDSDLRSWDERFKGARFEHARALVRDLEKVAIRIGVPTSAVAIGWLIAQPGMTAAIAGAKTEAQVIQNAQANRVLQSEKIVRIIDKIASIHGGW